MLHREMGSIRDYFLSAREYILIVARKWWAYLGFALSLVGYVVQLYTGLSLPPLVYILLSFGVLAMAQFSVYRDFKRTVAPLIERPPQMAIWANHAASASVGGAWVTVLIWGYGSPWDTGTTQLLAADVLSRLGLAQSAADIELFANGLRIASSQGSDQEGVRIQMDGEPATVLWQRRTTANSVDIAWILAQVEQSLSFVISQLGERVVPSERRRLLLGLSNWPAGGVSANTFHGAQRPYQMQPRPANRVVTPHYVAESRVDLTLAVSDFARRVMQEGGFVGFDAELDKQVTELVNRLWPAKVRATKPGWAKRVVGAGRRNR